jgi:hypothetical protein
MTPLEAATAGATTRALDPHGERGGQHVARDPAAGAEIHAPAELAMRPDTNVVRTMPTPIVARTEMLRTSCLTRPGPWS